jgi:hypothetical protein
MLNEVGHWQVVYARDLTRFYHRFVYGLGCWKCVRVCFCHLSKPKVGWSMFYCNLGRLLWELKLKTFMGNVTFLECSKDFIIIIILKCESCLIYDLYVKKDYLKKLGYGLLYLPSLMTSRCSKTKF